MRACSSLRSRSSHPSVRVSHSRPSLAVIVAARSASRNKTTCLVVRSSKGEPAQSHGPCDCPVDSSFPGCRVRDLLRLLSRTATAQSAPVTIGSRAPSRRTRSVVANARSSTCDGSITFSQVRPHDQTPSRADHGLGAEAQLLRMTDCLEKSGSETWRGLSPSSRFSLSPSFSPSLRGQPPLAVRSVSVASAVPHGGSAARYLASSTPNALPCPDLRISIFSHALCSDCVAFGAHVAFLQRPSGEKPANNRTIPCAPSC